MKSCCEESYSDIFAEFDKLFGQSSTHYELKTDGETSDIYVAVPGFLRVELNVSVDKSKNELTISGTPATDADTPRRKFTKPFTLKFVYKPTVHDVNGINVNLFDGILEVVVPLFPKTKQEDYIVSFPIK